MPDVAVNLAEALRVLIVGDGSHVWKGRFWPDEAPVGATMPYVTLKGPLDDVPRVLGDSRVISKDWLGQIDLWEKAGAEDQSDQGALEELKALVDGASLEAMVYDSDSISSARRVYRCRLRGVVRDPTGFQGKADEPKVAHHSLTVLLTYRAA